MNRAGQPVDAAAPTTRAAPAGGAIYDGNAHGSNFVLNTAVNGGAIWNTLGFVEIGIVNNSNFIANLAAEGGAIYSTGDVILLNSSFISNTATKAGVAVKWNHIVNWHAFKRVRLG